jgi:hypothetical protein
MAKTSKKLHKTIRQIFADVENDALRRIEHRDRNEEDHITTTIFTLAEEKINNGSFGKFRLRARQFSGRGPNSDESITGADGAVILNATYQDTEFRKFYLFQAKRFSEKTKFDERAIDQKYKMLSWSPDSFFLIYGPNKFSFVSAFIVGLNNRLKDLPTKNFTTFHEDFFNCFIGDHTLRFPWFPPSFPRHWHWEFWREFKNVAKFNEKNPLARKNLLIEVLLGE